MDAWRNPNSTIEELEAALPLALKKLNTDIHDLKVLLQSLRRTRNSVDLVAACPPDMPYIDVNNNLYVVQAQIEHAACLGAWVTSVAAATRYLESTPARRAIFALAPVQNTYHRIRLALLESSYEEQYLFEDKSAVASETTDDGSGSEP